MGHSRKLQLLLVEVTVTVRGILVTVRRRGPLFRGFAVDPNLRVRCQPAAKEQITGKPVCKIPQWVNSGRELCVASQKNVFRGAYYLTYTASIHRTYAM